MSENLERYDDGLPVLADDTLIHIAQQAEARIDAVIKIKQIALKVTNASDWVDQDGKPYLMASGSEKVANLFNISWRIDEPTMEQEADGTITYNYKGTFTLAGRSIDVEGSRSSRDTFFKKYEYVDGKRAGEKPLDRRDLKMAALTNLLGNGITRILGIRNLTYDDLEKFAGIKRDQVKGVKYQKRDNDRSPMQEPGRKSESNGNGAMKTADDLRREMWAMLLEMEGNDYDASQKLKEISGFEGKDGHVEGKDHVKDLSDKAVAPNYGKVKKLYEAWKEAKAAANG